MKKSTTKMSTLEKRIAKIKEQISKLDDLRRGSLSKQYNTCGTAGCKCKASPPKKHGPYYQLSFTTKGITMSKIRKDLEKGHNLLNSK